MSFVTEIHFADYRSRLANWNERSSVRAKPMRVMGDDVAGRPFSQGLVAVARHPLVTRQGDATVNAVLAQKLYSYLAFTEHLERKAVIPACVLLAHGEVPFATTRDLQRDASKIIVDEAHHAECAGDLTDQIAALTGQRPHRVRVPRFLTRLEAVLADTPEEERRLVLLTFSAVSETLITGTLTKVPADTSVDPVIREVIRDHAMDESKHHACFSDVIRIMWEGLGPRERDLCGPLFAQFITDFLSSDPVIELDWLEAAGFTAAEADRIITESHEDDAASVRADAAPTIRLMQRFGLLDHAATLDALGGQGLVV